MRTSARILAGLALIASSPAVAAAHGALRSSSPKAGAHLDRVPRELRLTFSERPERAFTRLELRTPDGRLVALGELVFPADSPMVVRAAIVGAPAGGVYRVAWQIAGKDGHPVRGTFSFVVAPGASGLDASSPLGDQIDTATTAHADGGVHASGAPMHHAPSAMPAGGSFDAESPLYAVVRWLTLMGIVGVIGASAFRYAVIERVNSRGAPAGVALIEPALLRAAGLGVWLAPLLIAAAVPRLYAQSVAMHGAADALRLDSIASMVAQTTWGRAWLLQVAGASVALAGFVVARSGLLGGWRAVAAGGLALAFAPALSGHAAAVERLPVLAVLSDAAHVVGASGWLGGLLFVVIAGVGAARTLAPDERGPAVAELVNAFSPTALLFAGLVVVTGLFAAWLHVGAVGDLWGTRYGRTLLVKLGVLSVVAGTGAYNWLRVRPVLGDEVGLTRVRRSSIVELTVAALALAVTSVLVATPPGAN